MLGHNKYVIPFQRKDEELPFNVAGLDTVKYNQGNFRSLAIFAVDKAISETSQDQPTQNFGTVVDLFLLIKNATVVNLQTDPGDQAIFELGSHFGFNLLKKFDGISYVFLGNFGALQTHFVIWRVSKLLALIEARIGAIPTRVTAGLAADGALSVLEMFLQRLEFWLVVAGQTEEVGVTKWINARALPLPFPIQIFTVGAINEIVSQLPDSGG